MTTTLITQTEFKEMVKTMPTLEVELDWDGYNGTYENSCHEITEFKDYKFSVTCDLSVYESHTTVIDRTFLVDNINVLQDEEPVELTTEQYEELRKVIINNIA